MPVADECRAPVADWDDDETLWPLAGEPTAHDPFSDIDRGEFGTGSLIAAVWSLRRHTAMAVARHRFERLAVQWERETGHLSNVSSRVLHPAYQQIIGMGENAIRPILEDLREN